MNKHPNAIIGGASAIGGGEAVVEILDQFGVHVSGGLGVFVAGTIGAAVLLVGRVGFRGVWRILLNGTGSRA